MIDSYQNRMEISEATRLETEEAFRAWHAGAQLSENQKRLITEARVDHNIRAFGKYLGDNRQIQSAKNSGDKPAMDRE